MTQPVQDRNVQIRTLSSDVRMEILKLLKTPKESFPNQNSAEPDKVGVCMHLIAERLRLSPPTVTRHMDLLRQAGFIKIQKQHRWSYCLRDEEALQEYHCWLGKTLLSGTVQSKKS